MTFLLAEDAALKGHLAGMTVSDEKSASRSVGVWFGYPDVELRQQAFPFVTIELMDVRQANDRQMSGQFVDSDNMGTTAVSTSASYVYLNPTAYDLTYQLTTYARHPRHDRAVMLQMHRKFPSKYGFLPIATDNGAHTYYRHMFLDEFRKADTVDSDATAGNKRLLRNVYTVRLVSEMPNGALTSTPKVQSVKLNQGTSTIPAGLIKV